MHACIHSFIHSCIHSCIHSWVQFIFAFMSLIHLFSLSFFHSFLPSFLHSFISSFLHLFFFHFNPSFFRCKLDLILVQRTNNSYRFPSSYSHSYFGSFRPGACRTLSGIAIASFWLIKFHTDHWVYNGIICNQTWQ